MEWISVKDRLPEVEGLVLVWARSRDPKSPPIEFAWFSPEMGGWEIWPQAWADSITHWIPLPAPPPKEQS